MNEKYQTSSKVAEKWGFGMAPPKKKTQISRNVACTRFLEILCSEELPDSDVNILEVVSIVKGLFNRIVREDQWDWFTVSRAMPESSAWGEITRLPGCQTALSQSRL